jgi:hypothetical protein
MQKVILAWLFTWHILFVPTQYYQHKSSFRTASRNDYLSNSTRNATRSGIYPTYSLPANNSLSVPLLRTTIPHERGKNFSNPSRLRSSLSVWSPRQLGKIDGTPCRRFILLNQFRTDQGPKNSHKGCRGWLIVSNKKPSSHSMIKRCSTQYPVKVNSREREKRPLSPCLFSTISLTQKLKKKRELKTP